MTRTLAMLCLISSMAMNGANVPIAKHLVAGIPPEPLLVLRFGVASLMLLVLARSEDGPRITTLSARQWVSIAILGLVGSLMFTWFILAGVRRTSAASAGIILAALPAVVALVGWARGERPVRGEIAMIALAVGGVVMIQFQSAASHGPTTTDSLLGNLMILMAVLCEAAFVVAARRISTEVPPLRLSLAVALISLAFCLIPAWPALAALDFNGIQANTWALFIWYTLAASVLGTYLWCRGVAHVETWAAGLATAAVPVSALAVSAAYLGETITPPQVAGAALVVSAITAGTLAQRRLVKRRVVPL
jgi:drug/metabolite transporter (DMT)-like permease